MTPDHPGRTPTRSGVILFTVIFLQTVLAIFFQVALPSSEKGVLFGLSAVRLAMLGVTVVVFLASLTGLVSILARNRLGQWLLISPQVEPARSWILASSLLTGLVSAFLWVHLFYASASTYTDAAIHQRTWPVLMLLSLSALETAGYLIWTSRGLPAMRAIVGFLVKSRWIALTLFILLAVIGITRLGLYNVDMGYWGFPTVPLLEWHWLLAGLLVLALALIEVWVQKHSKARGLRDWHVFLLIWAVTAIIWIATPLNPDEFAPPARAPTYEIYPFNDGMNYDRVAQSILTGHGLANGDIPPRPLYIVFLAFLHLVAGQDYHSVIAAQTLFLALFPAVVYLIGKELFNRPFGLGLAALLIIRDVFSNQVSPLATDISYSKYYFSELPTALLISAAVYLGIRWMKGVLKPWQLAAIGGLAGLAGLIRTQSLVILPVIALMALAAGKQRPGEIEGGDRHAAPSYPWYTRRGEPGAARNGRWTKWLRDCLLIGVTAILTLIPWIWRNYQLTGGLVFDHPATQTYVFAYRYAGSTVVADETQEEGESASAYSSRLMSIAIEGLLNRPEKVIPGVLAHVIHNQIENLQLIPVRDRLSSLREVFIPANAFWEGALERTNAPLLPLAGLLVVFGAGISAAWQRWRWIGLLPLAVNLAYNGWTALFLSSGERFLVPVDWAMMIYLFVGLLVIALGIARLFPRFQTLTQSVIENPGITPPSAHSSTDSLSWLYALIAVALFLFIGATIPFSEKVFPPLYPETSQGALLSALSSKSTVQAEYTMEDLQALLAQDGAQLYHGRAIFPRFYAAGEGEPLVAKRGYQIQDQPRFLFYIVGSTNKLVLMDLDQPPDWFPNTSDVILAARDDQGALIPSLVWIGYAEQEAIYASP